MSFNNKKIQKNTLNLTETKTKSLELFNNIQKGISEETNSYMENTMKYKYFDLVENSSKTYGRINILYSLNNNFITLILKATVFLFTFYLITLVKSTYLSLSSYLILTPYLTSSAQNLIEFFGIFPEIAIIDNILNELTNFNNPTETKSKLIDNQINNYNLQFYKVGLNSDNQKIDSISFTIDYKDIVLFLDTENLKVNNICDLISKKTATTSGSILIDNININNIPEQIYSGIVNVIYAEPFFYNVSIYENLNIICDNKTRINKAIKQFKFENMIDSLPDKINTIYDENISKNITFFLGILRAYLSDSKIICIITPTNLDKTEKELFLNSINILNQNSTVIVFSNANINDVNFSKVFQIKDNMLTSK